MHDRPQARTAPLAGSPCRGDRFPRSMQEPEPSSRHLHAGRHLGSQQAPPRLIPGLQSIPGFDVTFVFRHVISGSLSLAFLAHTCRAHRRDFSRDAHHHDSLPQQLTVVCGLRLHGDRGGPPSRTPGSSISCTAPHSESGSSTSSLLQRSWHTIGRSAVAAAWGRHTLACPALSSRDPAVGAGTSKSSISTVSIARIVVLAPRGERQSATPARGPLRRGSRPRRFPPRGCALGLGARRIAGANHGPIPAVCTDGVWVGER